MLIIKFSSLLTKTSENCFYIVNFKFSVDFFNAVGLAVLAYSPFSFRYRKRHIQLCILLPGTWTDMSKIFKKLRIDLRHRTALITDMSSFIPPPYLLILKRSLCTHYFGWMSCLISFVLALLSCEQWEASEKSKWHSCSTGKLIRAPVLQEVGSCLESHCGQEFSFWNSHFLRMPHSLTN